MGSKAAQLGRRRGEAAVTWEKRLKQPVLTRRYCYHSPWQKPGPLVPPLSGVIAHPWNYSFQPDVLAKRNHLLTNIHYHWTNIHYSKAGHWPTRYCLSETHSRTSRSLCTGGPRSILNIRKHQGGDPFSLTAEQTQEHPRDSLGEFVLSHTLLRTSIISCDLFLASMATKKGSHLCLHNFCLHCDIFTLCSGHHRCS